MKTTVILVNWNQARTSIHCIKSIFQNTKIESDFSLQVIVVDNNSKTEFVELLENFLEDSPHKNSIHLIKNLTNTGFAGGNNTGIKYTLAKHAPDYIWLLNNDVVIQEGALNHLAAAAQKHPEIKIWGSTIYEMYPRLHFHCAGGFQYNPLLSIPTPITFPKQQRLPSGLYHPLPKMDYPAGAAMFVRAEVFRESGLMNEDYFLYYEELDFVRQIGGKAHLAWCPDSVLHHQSGASTGSRNPNLGEGSRIAHYYGNLSALKYTWYYHRRYFPVVFLFRITAKSLLFIKHREFTGFAPLFGAYLDFFRWLAGKPPVQNPLP